MCDHGSCNDRAVLRGSGSSRMVLMIHLILHLHEFPPAIVLDIDCIEFIVCVCAYTHTRHQHWVYFFIAFQLTFLFETRSLNSTQSSKIQLV